jgi:geranylgeranyl diphosphate synthase type I
MEKSTIAVKSLGEYKKRLDAELERYFALKISEAKKIDPQAVRTIEILRRFTLSAGKRIRPALTYYGYLAAGGKDVKELLKASMAIELVHIFLLVHDDIIDRDEKRHGIETVHETYKKWGKELGLSDAEAGHFGNSMAIVAGDAAYLLANEILYRSNFKAEIIVATLEKTQEVAYRTTQGQMMDVLVGAKGMATEKEIVGIQENKTARYTFEGPLHLGATLAGKKDDQELLTIFSAYALPVGKAFQMRDDILGIFGDEKKLGKAVGADIIEGKQTLLIAKALERGSREQKIQIGKLLGKKDLSLPELEIFRKIIRDTGSLEYSEKLSEQLVAEALEALGKIQFENDEARNFLEGIAEYIIKREV